MAPKILKFFLVVFDIYTQPWTKLQNEIQKFCFFRTGYSPDFLSNFSRYILSVRLIDIPITHLVSMFSCILMN